MGIKGRKELGGGQPSVKIVWIIDNSVRSVLHLLSDRAVDGIGQRVGIEGHAGICRKRKVIHAWRISTETIQSRKVLEDVPGQICVLYLQRMGVKCDIGYIESLSQY